MTRPIVKDACYAILKSRQALGFTQAEMAEFCGVSRATVNSWEKGRSAVPVVKFHRILRLVRAELPDFVAPKHAPESFQLEGVAHTPPQGPLAKTVPGGADTKWNDAVRSWVAAGFTPAEIQELTGLLHRTDHGRKPKTEDEVIARGAVKIARKKLKDEGIDPPDGWSTPLSGEKAESPGYFARLLAALEAAYAAHHETPPDLI